MQPQFTEREIARFWSYVDKSGTCWLWRGGRSRSGYGQFSNGPKGSQVKRPAHRVAWMITYGAIPHGLYVLHDCPGGDNRACVNPNHLWLGDAGDNYHDAERKGRLPRGNAHPSRARPETRPRGEKHWKATLTAEQVLEIRARYRPRKVTYEQLASEYGVHFGQICSIVHRRSWKHLP